MASRLDDIFATVRGTRKINKKIGSSYTDEHGKTSYFYTNTKMLVEEPCKEVLKAYTKCVDFQSGFVQLFFTPNPNKPYPTYHSLVLPLDVFLNVFTETQKLDLGLHEHSSKLLEEWEALNGNDDSLGRRTNVERVFTLFRTEWSTGYNRTHFSEFEMQINSWGYTKSNNSVKDPVPIQPEDLKVVIKLKSSVNSKDLVDKSSLVDRGGRYEKDGLNVVLPHLQKLLRSQGFKKFVADVTSAKEEYLDDREDPGSVEKEVKKQVDEKLQANRKSKEAVREQSASASTHGSSSGNSVAPGKKDWVTTRREKGVKKQRSPQRDEEEEEEEEEPRKKKKKKKSKVVASNETQQEVVPLSPDLDGGTSDSE